MAQITSIHRSVDRSATLYVLSDGRAVREGVTGLMLLSEIGGDFVRYIDSLDEVVDKPRCRRCGCEVRALCNICIPCRNELVELAKSTQQGDTK